MSIEIKVPQLGESISTATVARWLKKPGEVVNMDEAIVELETDKVSVEVPSPKTGVMGAQLVQEGQEVSVGTLLTVLEDGASVIESAQSKSVSVQDVKQAEPSVSVPADNKPVSMPAARKMMEEKNITVDQVAGTGRGGRITRDDVVQFLDQKENPAKASGPVVSRQDDPREERVKMTRLRRTVARRLKEAQETAAMLTTFNEVDMSAVINMRTLYKEAFNKKHEGSRLGFMSFFVKATVSALQEYPAINAQIDGEDIIYRHFVNMGIAVGGPNGLVVPVLKDADQMSFAQIEGQIIDFAKRARSNTLKLADLSGGTFSITNGGIYGSLMSTPILNMPQSGILGMHAIKERPVAVNGQVVIRPMMYLALSYDHRIVDGKEAVSFLVHIKERIENPERLLLDV
ncbi:MULTISPECIES: 2-oxoglutarate dehydrogenase complex dihydrolipoyllysine-residue succinyltransferase [unclassified Commensalibacter]|uniref:2-oxoglutarate dehydrogenase complex dihydrolipoyllysine-residue succinyltransferase n=1 Tax=unclassified Commensalibacter TaxID=2630218 RepID=UPI0018DD992A|nr:MULTISPECIES: 2-oxoglutarate dehydrogenase complex dihydrolipoyllysine-residue succinyltransferase [unclassified Commensalibacter]MBH9970330.1 2-oxoglutarate dehydrogenase complex dihydrolipoyllysine-residue succinyltransferase [Commensalibacter sp. M0265]MBH9977484.1 2-oxoglutarate dehydrogenase complex dihydrolipoyllysine-residue succinyltransferase [Commensalibacter sp. M0266]MBH9993365.1 2-oxoglutarate dehydrogenase complex dihydrolipoyllysine-residue succinyltransferase [Commensalibacter